MAITKIGKALLAKQAATKWKSQSGGLSPETNERINSGSFVKSPKAYANGINRYTNKLFRSIGVTPVNISGPTDNQLRQANKRTQKAIKDAYLDGDSARMKLFLDVLQNRRKFALVGNGETPQYIANLMLAFTKNPIEGKGSLYNALSSNHEANEGVSHFKNNVEVYNNPSAKAIEARQNYIKDELNPNSKNYNELKKVELNPRLSTINDNDLVSIERYSRKLPGTIGAYLNNSGKPFLLGNHHGLSVLLNERKALDKIPVIKRYDSANQYRELRNASSENAFIDTVRGNKNRFLSTKDIKKLISNNKNFATVNIFGRNIPMRLTHALRYVINPKNS